MWIYYKNKPKNRFPLHTSTYQQSDTGYLHTCFSGCFDTVPSAIKGVADAKVCGLLGDVLRLALITIPRASAYHGQSLHIKTTVIYQYL